MKESDPEFKRLYNLLTDVYQQVQADFNIPEKQKHFERYEARMGCLYLAILIGGFGVVIYGILPWYWLGFVMIGIVMLAGIIQKKWDMRYVNVFLEKMSEERQKDSESFDFVLVKWIRNLPKNDRAKNQFQKIIKTKSQRKFEPDKSESDEYNNYEENNEYDKNSEHDEYGNYLPDSEELSSSPDPAPSPAPPPLVKDAEVSFANQEEEETLTCPRCGSDWIRYEEKEEEEIFGVCENCSKKWKL